MRIGLPAVLLSAALLSACADDSSPAAKGKQIYLAQCITCHNSDPSKPGPLGPPVNGSSPELLEAKLLRGSYPPGYSPKRNTAIMPPQPQLAPYVQDLAVFLR